MALRQTTLDARLKSVVDQVARVAGALGVKEGSGSAVLRVTQEIGIKRVIQAYWTPFEVNVPGRSIGVHLEVAEPKVRWAECYLSPEFRNWVLCFHERDDGEVQLAYYADYATPAEALEGFVELSEWYVLTASDLKWADVALEVDEDLGWSDHLKAVASPATSGAIQESLKKSTILWLRYDNAQTVVTMPVWFLFDNKTSKIYVLSGERQQSLPGAERIREATVILRWKGKNSQVAEIGAYVRVLEHGPEWDEVAEKIAEKRLNIPGLPEDTAKRWRDECHILELTLHA
ncbi:MAG TPA: hypothetical protein VG408_07960 [Actinomycetota bacterium]|nr:hypothetical protein [Actinomycetota bacterium]